EIVEVVASRLRLLTRQIWQLVVTIQMHLEGLAADICVIEKTFLDICVASSSEQRGKPVEARNDVVRDFACLDPARPADHRRHAERTFPVGSFLAAKLRCRSVRP